MITRSKVRQDKARQARNHRVEMAKSVRQAWSEYTLHKLSYWCYYGGSDLLAVLPVCHAHSERHIPVGRQVRTPAVHTSLVAVGCANGTAAAERTSHQPATVAAALVVARLRKGPVALQQLAQVSRRQVKNEVQLRRVHERAMQLDDVRVLHGRHVACCVPRAMPHDTYERCAMFG